LERISRIENAIQVANRHRFGKRNQIYGTRKLEMIILNSVDEIVKMNVPRTGMQKTEDVNAAIEELVGKEGYCWILEKWKIARCRLGRVWQ